MWENLLRKTVAERRPLSPPPSMFIQNDATTIGEGDLTKLPFKPAVDGAFESQMSFFHEQ
jgi:hypothetical protein